MPIRINLLAEQQAAEEARRRDPVKRALVMGTALVVGTLLWTLMTYMQVKARRAELANLETAFKQVDEKAKVVRIVQADSGDIEWRIASLDRYSTNRLLWASILDALQRTTIDEIRLKSITASQRYVTNAPNIFFTTNINVPFEKAPPKWKFWASSAKQASATDLASKVFRTFTNQPPFSTNSLPYTVKMAVASTNLVRGEMAVKCDFALPAVATEDTEVFLAGGDYGNPPGAKIDDFSRIVGALPYFSARLTSRVEDRLRFTDLPPNAEPDLLQPNTPMYKRFTLRLKFADRILTNE